MRHRGFLFGMILALLCAIPARADGLYEARTIVTGMGAGSRPAGLSRALALVLAKVSGHVAWRDDPRAAALDPAPLLQGFVYLDRMSDQPKHDEQGTRDRPYDLVARFDPAAVDALLRSWDDRPWPPPRPLLRVALDIVPRRGPAMTLRADTDADERHRAALLDAAGRMGLDLVIPATDALPSPADLPVLHGTLRWSEAEAGWVAAWELAWQGAVHRWGLRGVGFDAAYRDGVGGAAAVLAGPR